MGTRPSPGRRRPAFAAGEGFQPERGSRMKQWLFWALSLAPLLEPLRHLGKAAQALEVLVAVICLQFVIGPHTARRRGAMRAVPFLGAWLPALLLLVATVPPGAQCQTSTTTTTTTTPPPCGGGGRRCGEPCRAGPQCPRVC